MKQRISRERYDFEKATEQMWVEEAERALKGKSIETLSRKTYEGITLRPVYTEQNSRAAHQIPRHLEKQNGWEVSQKLQKSKTPEELKAEIHEALKCGQDTIHLEDVSFLNTYEDIQIAFENTELSATPFHISLKDNIGFFPIFTAFLKNRNGSGRFAFDPLGEWIESGGSRMQITEKLDAAADMMKALEEANLPDVKTILVDGQIYRNAGASAKEELAYTFANAIELFNALKERGVPVDVIAARTAFSFSAAAPFFMEIAKFRAAKKLWAAVLNGFGADPEKFPIDLHATTSLITKTKHDIHVNMLRAATEAFSAAAGGVSSLSISPFDEVQGKPGKTGERVARNTHYVLKEESHLAKVQDPAAGSWYIEELTSELAEQSWKEIQAIETLVGFTEAAKNEYIQNHLSSLLEKRLEDISKRSVQLIGTNVYANLQESAYEAKAEEKVKPDKSTAHSAPDIAKWIQDAYTVTATELNSLMYRDDLQDGVKPLLQKRLSEPFEELRAASSRFKEETGSFPFIQVVVFGEPIDYKARLDFTAGLLAAGGVEAKITAMDEAEADKPVILCGTDEEYGLLDLKNLSEKHPLFLAGRFKTECAASLYQGMNVHEFLKNLHSHLGVK
ncbi:methylmalonyl-CoA mutase family protein [Metabacillus indicus]|uniref:methylmalonyl-CoA mutase family protein n=1 Tax=Metabacillus indicus TaxID=246786 RepID=UPI003984234A